MNEYIDTRGPWPLYIRGCVAVELRGKSHDISLSDAATVGTAIINADNTPDLRRFDS